MNIDNYYPSHGDVGNQLQTLADWGLVTGNLSSLEPFPFLDNTDTSLDRRARAYLHENCGYCHRPNGPGQGPMDFRFEQSFVGTSSCNVFPTDGDLGIFGATILTPGAHDLSILWERMSRRGPDQMPPLASDQVDAAGAALLQEWIDGLSGCSVP
jgi:mono/diheme cytochrome c family protein